jgi:hypothetical protein
VAPFYEDDMTVLKDVLGVDRLLFGSDWPHAEGFPSLETSLWICAATISPRMRSQPSCETTGERSPSVATEERSGQELRERPDTAVAWARFP